jgi:transcriptional regulator with XRE-family HTH domain
VSNIKNLCKTNNIPISKLEKDLGFGSGLISRWANADPSLSKIIDIANFFYVSLDGLVGRKMRRQDEESLIPLLLKLTQTKKIVWNDGEMFSFPTDIENLEIYQDEREILWADLAGGYLYLVAQYTTRHGRFEEMDLEIYLQPNSDSLPVLQGAEYSDLYDLWLAARYDIFGVPDDYKADKFVSDILSKYKDISD